jgi:hypothetical protein
LNKAKDMKSKNQMIQQPLNIESVSEYFLKRGYFIFEKAGNGLQLKRLGTAFSSNLDRLPLELSFDVQDCATSVSLKYDCWVLFDTGDLASELSRIVNSINRDITTLT